jgi:hypothetical protein
MLLFYNFEQIYSQLFSLLLASLASLANYCMTAAQELSSKTMASHYAICPQLGGNLGDGRPWVRCFHVHIKCFI